MRADPGWIIYLPIAPEGRKKEFGRKRGTWLILNNAESKDHFHLVPRAQEPTSVCGNVSDCTLSAQGHSRRPQGLPASQLSLPTRSASSTLTTPTSCSSGGCWWPLPWSTGICTSASPSACSSSSGCGPLCEFPQARAGERKASGILGIQSLLGPWNRSMSVCPFLG